MHAHQMLADCVLGLCGENPIFPGVCPDCWHLLQAAAVHSAVVKGWKEMDDMPLDETLGMARCLDEIRRQIKLIYPQDNKSGCIPVSK